MYTPLPNVYTPPPPPLQHAEPSRSQEKGDMQACFSSTEPLCRESHVAPRIGTYPTRQCQRKIDLNEVGGGAGLTPTIRKCSMTWSSARRAHNYTRARRRGPGRVDLQKQPRPRLHPVPPQIHKSSMRRTTSPTRGLNHLQPQPPRRSDQRGDQNGRGGKGPSPPLFFRLRRGDLLSLVVFKGYMQMVREGVCNDTMPMAWWLYFVLRITSNLQKHIITAYINYKAGMTNFVVLNLK